MTLPLEDTLPPQPWSASTEALLALAAVDLHAQRTPLPTLAAYAGDDPIAMVTLRPFERDELVQALVEVLALLLPLGTDRVALALPGRVWSLDDPIPPVADGVDLRTRVVVVTTADAHAQRCTVKASLHPYEERAVGWVWLDPVDPGDAPEAPLVSVLTVLLDGREELGGDPLTLDQQLAVQFGRVLLRGHEVALTPEVALRLELATAGPIATAADPLSPPG